MSFEAKGIEPGSAKVALGDKVVAGNKIGVVGESLGDLPAHLHFKVTAPVTRQRRVTTNNFKIPFMIKGGQSIALKEGKVYHPG